jgi:hypothetical protein
MRLGVFLLVIVVAFATTSAPAGAQLPVLPQLEGVLEVVESALDPGSDEADEDDDNSGPGGGGDQGGPDSEGPGSGDEADDLPDDGAAPEGGPEAPPVDEPEGGGGSGDPEPDGSGSPAGHEGAATRAGARDESGSANEDDVVATSAQSCSTGCSSSERDHPDVSDPPHAGETPGGLQAESRALSYVEPEASSPGPVALLVLVALGLIVGLAGALRALRSRLRGAA